MPTNLSREQAKVVWKQAVAAMDALDAKWKPVIAGETLVLGSHPEIIKLLLECAREMDGAAADIDIYANPVIANPRAFQPMHPLTLRPEALRRLAEEIRKVLDGPDA